MKIRMQLICFFIEAEKRFVTFGFQFRYTKK